jgi:hypothetical protein
MLLIIGGCTVLQPAKVEQPVMIENIKNPSPITKENELSLRHLRSIAIAPFVDERSVLDGWAEASEQLLKGNKRLHVEGPDKVKLFLIRIKKPIEQVPGEERPKIAQRVGNALKTDGVIAGIILPLGREDNRTVYLELIQTSTGKVLWWQALDLFVKKDRWESSKGEIIKRVLPDILNPLLDILGTSEGVEKPKPKKPKIDISPM